MEFKGQIKQLGESVAKNKDYIKTEEATKNALVIPLIQILGYDPTNPREVVPEFNADYGAKNIEKVDFAILKDSQPILVIECKHISESLIKHYTQTHKYFHMTSSRIGILTNGIHYNFFSDLDNPNKMDEAPFLSFDITSMTEQDIMELAKFRKNVFNVDAILDAAQELKYSNAIKNLLRSEFSEPTVDFIKYFVNQIYQGRLSGKKMNQFTEIFKKSFERAFTEIINEKNATIKIKTQTDTNSDAKIIQNENKINTTEEEINGFYIIKSMLRTKIDPGRIFYRDVQSYFSVILDDKISKPVCRLWLNNPSKKYIGLLDKDNKEIKKEIASLDDIYKYSEELITKIDFYENEK